MYEKVVLKERGVDINYSIHAINHALLVVAPIFAQVNISYLYCFLSQTCYLFIVIIMSLLCYQYYDCYFLHMCIQCDVNDLACEHIHLPSSMMSESDKILIYDKVPGGLGISDRLYDQRYALLSSQFFIFAFILKFNLIDAQVKCLLCCVCVCHV